MELISRVLEHLVKVPLTLLPESVRFALLRRLFRFAPYIEASLVVKIAETPKELEAAFALVRQTKNDHRTSTSAESSRLMQLNKYQLLPSSTVVVAYDGDQIVGTLTLVKRRPLGLPLEEQLSIADLLTENERVAEVICLAIAPTHRRARGKDILFPLLKFAYHYAFEYFAIEKLFIVCGRRTADFYRSLFFFQKIKGTPDLVDAHGRRASALWVDLRSAPERLHQTYLGMASERSLYRYLIEYFSTQLQFPERRYYRYTDSIWNFNTLLQFAGPEGPYAMPNLTKTEKVAFVNSYGPKDPLRDSFWDELAFDIQRNYRRFECHNRILFADEADAHSPRITMREISRAGFCAVVSNPVALNSVHEFSLQVSESEWTKLKAQAIYQTTIETGFKILEADPLWDQYLSFLENNGEKQPA